MSSQEIGALIKSVNDMTQTVVSKMKDIDEKVKDSVLIVPRTIRNQFDVTFYLNPSIGNDDNDGIDVNRPLRTLSSALSSNRTPAGARIYIECLSSFDISEIETFSNKHVMIDLNKNTIRFPSKTIHDSSGLSIGSGIGRIQGLGQNSSLVLFNGNIETGDVEALIDENHWTYKNSQVLMQMGGVDYDGGFYPVVLTEMNILLGKNVIGIASGNRGSNIYPGQGVLCVSAFKTSINTSAHGSVDFGYGVHFRNNKMYDAIGNIISGVAV